ncbi:MAG: hypothetical protein AAF636_19870 [Pseudomonadota bacterium]
MSVQQFFSEVLQLVADAGISFGFIKGTGLGAVLLTIIVIAYLSRNRRPAKILVELAKAMRPKNLGASKSANDANDV